MRESYHRKASDIAVWAFIDFVCLPQYRRSEEEQEFFQRAMLSMHLLYAHHFILGVYRLDELTPESEKSQSGFIQIYCEATGKLEARPFSELVLNSTPYFQRGWCVAEVQWMCAKDMLCGFSPMRPAVFQDRVARGEQGLSDGLALKFTHRSDMKAVVDLQEKVFLQHARQRTKLLGVGLPQRELVILADALPHFKNLQDLQILGPSEGLGGGVVELARALEHLHSERLVAVAFQGKGIRDAGAAALAAAFAACKNLSVIDIESDDIGDAGAEALAAAVAGCRKLRRFRLSDCSRIRDAGIAALASASLMAPDVEFRFLGHVSDLATKSHHKWGKVTHSDAF